MNIRQLAEKLQKKIDAELQKFNLLKENFVQLNEQLELIEKQMADIVFELEPVEFMIFQQNPHLKNYMESLKRVYGEVNEQNTKDGNKT